MADRKPAGAQRREQGRRREAQFRYELTRVRESAEQVALINGENDERAALDTSLRDLIGRWYAVIRDRSRVGVINASNTVLARSRRLFWWRRSMSQAT